MLDDFLTEIQSDDFATSYQEWLNMMEEVRKNDENNLPREED